MSILPEGWVEFAERWESRGARKWFGDHYKEVVVAKEGGDLVAAATAVDQEAALRAQATTDAANAHADELEARAVAIRSAGDVTVSAPVAPEAAPPADAVHETVEPTAPIVVPTIEELRAKEAEIATEITALETQDSGQAAPPEAQPSGEPAAEQTGEPAATA